MFHPIDGVKKYILCSFLQSVVQKSKTTIVKIELSSSQHVNKKNKWSEFSLLSSYVKASAITNGKQC